MSGWFYAPTDTLKYFSRATTQERHLVVVTDGQVSGEDAVLRRISQAAGQNMPRIFTVGIDEAVNGGFLKRLADLGRGHCELVESESRLDEAMNRIHRQLGAPVLTQVRIEPLNFDLLADSLAPHEVPDLFADRPVTVYGRHLSGGPLRIRVHAFDAAGKAWQEEVIARTGPAALLQSVWGRAKVRELEDIYAAGQSGNQDELMRKIVSVSLESHVLSRFTAYVAVDRSEVVNEGGQLQQVVQPVDMPAGWAEPQAKFATLACFGGGIPAAAMPFARGGSGSPPKKARSRKILSAGSPPPSETVDSDRAIDLTSLELSPQMILDAENETVIVCLEYVIQIAVKARATEIHIELLADQLIIKYLADGKFSDLPIPPIHLHSAIVARIRDLAKLDSASPTYPQEGRFEAPVGASFVAWQVRITLTPHGESVVLTLESLTTATGEQPPEAKRKRFWS